MGKFYDEVLRELVLGLGAALFVGNALALARRRSDARRTAGTGAGGRARGGLADDENDLPQAPLARTVTYMLIGLIVSAWVLASIFVG